MCTLSSFQINSSSQDGAQFEPAVTVLSDGRMVIVWRTIARYYDPTQSMATYEIAYRVLNADGGFMTLWNGLGDLNTEVFGQRFDANGNPLPKVVPISVIDPDQNLRGTAPHDVIGWG